jgi:hypothetical protein
MGRDNLLCMQHVCGSYEFVLIGRWELPTCDTYVQPPLNDLCLRPANRPNGIEMSSGFFTRRFSRRVQKLAHDESHKMGN